jgi:hypothetical protein
MITIDDLKYWLQIKPANTGQEELDEFIQDCIDEAVDTAEEICNQKLAYCKNTFTVDYSYDKTCGHRKSLYLYFPVDIITKIQYVDPSNGLTDIISSNNSGITSGIYIDSKSGLLKLLQGYYFRNAVNVIELYHGYKDNFVSKAITAVASGENEQGATAIFTIGSHTRNNGDVIRIDGIVDFENNPKGIFRIIAKDDTTITIQFDLGDGDYTAGGTVEYEVNSDLSIPKKLKKCIKLIATQIYNNSSLRDSRFGLASTNMNASGSSGKVFRSDKELSEYINLELKSYEFVNV